MSQFGSHRNGLQSFQPRTFSALHAERSYLLSLLEAEDSKHKEFLWRIPTLTQSLNDPTVTDRRKIKKQIGWFKHRLNETIQQERAIIGSLGQLAYEIQCRERISQLENEQRFHVQAARHHHEMASRMEIGNGMGIMSLNPACADFQPQRTMTPTNHFWRVPGTTCPQYTQQTPGWQPQQQLPDYFGNDWASPQPPPSGPSTRDVFLSPSDNYPTGIPINTSTTPSSSNSHYTSSLSISPRTLPAVQKLTIPDPHITGQRSVSLNCSSEKLDHLTTGTADGNINESGMLSVNETERAKRAKRASLPALPGSSRIWEMGMSEVRRGSWVDVPKVSEEEEKEKGKGKGRTRKRSGSVDSPNQER